MAEKSQIPRFFCIFCTIILAFLLIAGYFTFIYDKWQKMAVKVGKLERENRILQNKLNKTQISVAVKVDELEQDNQIIKNKLNETQMSVALKIDNLEQENRIFEEKLNNLQFKVDLFPPPIFDEPTEISPKMISNGVFLTENSQFLSNDEKTDGRKPGDLEDVAVLIEVHEKNNTDRWINAMKMQRKTRKELHIYLFSSKFDLKNLKKMAQNREGVTAIPHEHLSLSIDELYNKRYKRYIILINDNDFISEDFADFYFLGKTVMENDYQIGSVCGGSNEKWQNETMGDVFWLADVQCERGLMIASFSPDAQISLRPEVARVAKFQKSVTDSTWNIDRFDPSLLKTAGFEMRLEYDLGIAEKLSKSMWKTLSLQENKGIYMFPYQNSTELRDYLGEDEEKILKYKGIIPLNKETYKVYLVPEYTYEKRIISDNFEYY